MSLIEFRGVRKAFGPKVVYRDLNLTIEEGELLTIIGGSGQGKSVMLKMLIGLLGIDEGAIFFDGQEISKFVETEYAPVRRRVAMLFQAGALFDSLNAKENVAYGLREQLEISDRITMIHEGFVIFSGTPDEVRAADDPRVRDFIEGNAPVDEDTETLLKSAG